MMSLGAGALKVSGGPNAISREEVSMATLEAGTTPRVATNRHHHTEQITKPPGREGGEGARIRNDSQEGNKLIRYHQQESTMICKKANIDPLWSASKATMQSNNSKRAHKEPCNSPQAAP